MTWQPDGLEKIRLRAHIPEMSDELEIAKLQAEILDQSAAIRIDFLKLVTAPMSLIDRTTMIEDWKSGNSRLLELLRRKWDLEQKAQNGSQAP